MIRILIPFVILFLVVVAAIVAGEAVAPPHLPASLPSPSTAAPSAWADLAATIAGILSLALAWLAKALAQAISQVAVGVAERLGMRLSEDRQRAIELFAESQIRAMEEKHIAGLVVTAGTKGSEKLKLVSDAIKAKFPSISDAEVDVIVHSIIHKLENVGASSKP